jgi:polygalacturonase
MKEKDLFNSTNFKGIIIILFFFMSINFLNATIILPNIPATQFLITSYGASTSSTDNSSFINAAISAANGAGGGTVVIPAGTFLSGPITMKSTVNLYISSGAILQILPYGSGNGTPAGSYPNNGTTDTYTPFIFGSGLNNIEVSGSGTIEGNGSAWWTAFASLPNMSRPCLIRFKACNYVLITGITLQNSPGVHVTLGQSSSMGSNGTISNITVIAPSTSPNTDAIDTWYWNGINILHCNLSEGDDNVAMDSYSTNVTITDCTFGTGHGVSVGSYALGVNNVKVDSCTFTGTTNGIRLKSERGRGNNVYNLSYSNITMNNVEWPFYITSYYNTSSPSTSDPAQAVTSTTPSWREIYFKNITVTNSTYAGFLWGLPEQYIDNVVFDNVKIAATSRGMQTCFVDTLIFKNGSSITIPGSKGNAIYQPFDTLNVSGINTTTGKSTAISTGIENINANSIRCFPNPLIGDNITISSDLNIVKVKIFSLTGIEVKEENGNKSTQLPVNLYGITAGCYVICVVNENGSVNSMKLLKE